MVPTKIYLIRVELHHAQKHHYVDLHHRLAKIGVTDVIDGRQNTRWRLPPAEYTYTGAADIEEVLKAVKSVANSVILSNAVVVTEAANWRADGLQQLSSNVFVK